MNQEPIQREGRGTKWEEKGTRGEGKGVKNS